MCGINQVVWQRPQAGGQVSLRVLGLHDARALRVRAGKTRTGTCSNAPGAALRAFVGFVAGNFHFEEGARGDVPFDPPAAAVDNGAGRDGKAAFLFDNADRFTR